MQAKTEINELYSDEILDNNDIKMEVAMLIISTEASVRNDTIQDLYEIDSQFLSSQAKKGEQLSSMMPAIKKFFF